MADVERNVETHFSVDGGGAIAAVSALKGSMSGLGGLIDSITSRINPLNIAIGALGGAVSIHALTELGSQFEQTQNVVAGFMSTLGVSTSFAAGLEDAAGVMEKIRVDAAALPGEASEYIEVFKAGLPVVQKAVGGTVAQMTAFTNRYTAIAKTLQVDVGQAARDLQLMLRAGTGGAGMHVKTFTQLLPFMRQVKGQADLTREAFNKMTEQKRAELLTETFKKLDPMLENASNTFDAMSGALKSNSETLLRLGTAPLFDGIKAGLGVVNNALFDADGKTTAFADHLIAVGQTISREIVGGFKDAYAWVSKLVERFEGFGSSPAFKALSDTLSKVAGAAGGVGQNVAALAGIQKKEDQGPDTGPLTELLGLVSVASTVFGAFNPLATLVTSTLASLAGRGEWLSGIFEDLMSIVGHVAEYVEPLSGLFAQAGELLGDLVAAVLPPLLEGFDALVVAGQPIVAAMINVASTIMNQLKPAFDEVASAFGTLVGQILTDLAPALTLLGEGMVTTTELMSGPLVSALSELAKASLTVIAAFSSLLKWIEDKTGIALGGGGGGGGGFAAEQVGGSLVPTMSTAQAVASGPNGTLKGAESPGGGAHGGGGRAVQDFRFSKFEITQKFAEGFDPDRIAVAFAQDIGRMGETRQQSGFEPLYAVR